MVMPYETTTSVEVVPSSQSNATLPCTAVAETLNTESTGNAENLPDRA